MATGQMVAFEEGWAGAERPVVFYLQALRPPAFMPVFMPVFMPAIMLGLRMAMGAGVGVVPGVASGNLGIWLTAGMLLGGIFGAFLNGDAVIAQQPGCNPEAICSDEYNRSVLMKN